MRPDLRKIWPTLLLCTVLLSLGGVAGFLLRPIILPTTAVVDKPDEAPTGTGHGAEVVEVLEKTMDNLNLKYGKFEVREYSNRIRIPAEVVEKIPQSRRSVTAAVAGRITKVYIAQGQAVRPNERLFELQITDKSLSQAQTEMLGVLSELDINQKELTRLRRLYEQGVVARKRLIAIDFEVKKLLGKRDSLKQTLRLRGMDDEKISNLITNKQLSQTITVLAPPLENLPETSTPQVTLDPSANTVERASFNVDAEESAEADKRYFTVESINAFEGTSLELGQQMCELTHHSSLLIKGYAYEVDIEQIATSQEKGKTFTARFGEDHHQHQEVREGLKLFQIDNHVDTKSQTYPIYIEIGNEILSRTTDKQNRTYVNWRFKPGQRAHLEFPIETYSDQVVAPLSALVREGPETFVFVKIGHTHESPEGTVHEFKKIAVKVLHSDQQFAVLSPAINLDIYEEYALDQAYKLNQILNLVAGGAAPHAGHSHD